MFSEERSGEVSQPGIQEMLDDINAIIKMGGSRAEVFRTKDVDFIESIIDRYPCPLSKRQMDWIRDLWDKIPTF